MTSIAASDTHFVVPNPKTGDRNEGKRQILEGMNGIEPLRDAVANDHGPLASRGGRNRGAVRISLQARNPHHAQAALPLAAPALLLPRPLLHIDRQFVAPGVGESFDGNLARTWDIGFPDAIDLVSHRRWLESFLIDGKVEPELGHRLRVLAFGFLLSQVTRK